MVVATAPAPPVRVRRRATGRAASFGLSPIVSLKQSSAFVGRRGRDLQPPALRRLDEQVARRPVFMRGAQAPAARAQRLERAEIFRLNGARHGGERASIAPA